LQEQDVNIELTKDAKEFLIEKGFDVVFGARPLKRTITRFIEDPLAQALLKGEIDKVKPTIIKCKDDRFSF